MPKRLIILYLCLYISMIGYGISLPIVPYFLQKLAQSTSLGPPEVSLHVGTVTAVFAFMQMIFSPLWGRWSDFTGRRKPIMLLGLAGYAFSMALAGLSKSIAMLYFARMLNGVFSAAVLPIASAYIVDVVEAKDRGKGLAWHGTAVGLGVVSGPALGAYIGELARRHPLQLGFIEIDNFSSAFLFAALLAVIAMIIAAVWLAESSPNPKDRDVWQKGLEKSRFGTGLWGRPILVFLTLAFVSQFGLALFEGTFVLHAQKVMSFTAAQLGKVFMVCGFVMAAAQGTTVAGFIDKFGAEKILPFGYFCMGTALIALMVVRSMNLILIVVAVLAIGMAIATPSIAVLVSQGAKNRLGRDLGLLAGANSLGQTIGPLAGSLLFVYNIHLPYLFAAFTLFLAALPGFIRNVIIRK